MIQAKDFFRKLGGKNIFQPKVLAKVSRHSGLPDEKPVFWVGCSMSVSSFLRPLSLHNRVATFNCRLREAVVLDSHLDPGDQKGQWSSSAFMRGGQDDRPPGNQKGKRETGYAVPKNPCRNCRDMFQELPGFLPSDAEEGNRDTFLGACAEYLPVNELLQEDTQDRSTVAVQKKLKEHLDGCIYLLKNYRKIAEKCCECYNEATGTLKKDQQLLTAAYDEVQHIHIFGFKPKLKM